jgi:hypothetical protein
MTDPIRVLKELYTTHMQKDTLQVAAHLVVRR